MPWIKSLLALLVCCAVSSAADAQEKVKLDAEKSKIEFVGKKTDGQHTGGFEKFDATAMLVHDTPSKSTLKIEIETASLYADDPRLAAHLKNPDFFDVRKFPKITFDSKEIVMKENDTAEIVGTLTMLGKEEEVRIPVEYDVSEEKVQMTADFKIDRTRWGMTYGEGKIDKEVAIKADLRFNR